jgi:hypothetical protein
MKDLIISKLREMVKVKKPKVKKTEPTEADRADFAAWQDKKERDREPSDIEDERNQMAKHYGQQSEAIAFSKKTILGQAARPMAAQMLKKRKAELQREPALANKGGAVAKELKAFSKDTYKQRGESTDLKSRIVGRLLEKRKVNPWAVCHASTGPEKSDKFERCVMDVKEKHGIKEGTLADRLINILAEAFLGTSRDYVARAMSREDKGSSMKDRSKKGKALASVINKQPKVIKAKAEKKAADDAQDKANRAKGGNSNLRSSDSATHWRNNWPSGSWGSA